MLKKNFSRRDFLKGLATTGIATATTMAIPVIPKKVLGAVLPAQKVTVFRFRTRNTRSCNACKAHHRFKIFLTQAHAELNRAHPGCNCPIETQMIARQKFHQLFIETGAINEGVVDLRHHVG